MGTNCPFLSFVKIKEMCEDGHTCSSDGYLYIYDQDPTKVPCMEVECRLWDENKEECGLLTKSGSGATVDLSEIESLLNQISGSSSKISQAASEGVEAVQRNNSEQEDGGGTLKNIEENTASTMDSLAALLQLIQIVIGTAPGASGPMIEIVQLILSEVSQLLPYANDVIGHDRADARRGTISKNVDEFMDTFKAVVGNVQERSPSLVKPHPDNPVGSILHLLQHINGHHFDRINSSFAWAAALANEYFGNQDLDDNGKIYGIDFHITGPGTQSFPLMNPETGEQFVDQDTGEKIFIEKTVGDKDNTDKPQSLWNLPNGGAAMSWSDYLASVGKKV